MVYVQGIFMHLVCRIRHLIQGKKIMVRVG